MGEPGRQGTQVNVAGLADRIGGLMSGLAYGDALGAGYQGLGRRRRPASIRLGRGLLAWRSPGRWTDHTDRSLAVLLALARANGIAWPDGVHPSAVDRLVPERLDDDAVPRLITSLWKGKGRRREGGAVVRAVPVVLGYLGEPQGAYRAASRISALTHAHPRAREAAGIWAVLCERALVTGRLAVQPALECVQHDPFWGDRLLSPGRPGSNGARGSAPAMLTDAWWCATRTEPLDRRIGVVTLAAVAAGGDAGTTAALAGALTGALSGLEDLPPAGRALVHGGGWTGRRWTIDDLAGFARECAR
jgi:ADP-ribosylglycohydrolase